VHNKEQHEILVVVEANTVVDPDTMVIKLLATHVAQSAVLAASRLGRFARITPALRVEQNVIVVVALYGAFNLFLVGALFDKAGIGGAGQVVGVVARHHPGPGNVLVVACEVGVGNVHETVHDVQVVAADSESNIHAHDGRVRLIAHIRLGAFKEPYNVLAARTLSHSCLYADRDRFIKQTLGLVLNAIAFATDEDEAVEEGD